MLNNLYFCGKLYDADCVVNKVDGKIIGERWFEEDLDESGCGLIGVMSWLCPGGTERIFLFEFSINILSPPNALLAHTYHPLSFHHSNHTRWAVMLMKLLTMQFSVRLLSATNTNTATLTSKRCILYIYSKNISTEYFVFSSSKCSLFHNSKVFGSCIIHILYTRWAKIKKKIIPAPKG